MCSWSRHRTCCSPISMRYSPRSSAAPMSTSSPRPSARSHGIHAEPVTFGLKMAQAYAEFFPRQGTADRGARGHRHLRDQRRGRHLRQYRSARGRTCRRQARPHGRAGLDAGHPARPPCHVLRDFGRDRFLHRAACTEVRHLQRTEVLEAEEYFSPGQKGSSAMPHKRNPVLTENLTGLARVVRSAVVPALENVALWHERDISHSSVERFIGPDATTRSISRSRASPASSTSCSSIPSAWPGT